MNRDKEEELRAKAEGIPYFLVGPRSLTSSSRLQQVNDRSYFKITLHVRILRLMFWKLSKNKIS